MTVTSNMSNHRSHHTYNYCMKLTDVKGNVQFVNFEYFPSEKEIGQCLKIHRVIACLRFSFFKNKKREKMIIIIMA